MNFSIIPASKRSISLRKSIYGVGRNNASYKTEIMIDGKRIACPIYLVWVGVIQRCHDPKIYIKHPTYVGCTVVDEWLTFSNFRAWMIKQDWQEKQLDKDILIPGNKKYGPDTCVFVDKATNCLLTDSGASRGKWPKGVSYNKQRGKFTACVSIDNKLNFLGYFNTSEQAEAAYKSGKAVVIARAAIKQDDLRVFDALMNRAHELNKVVYK